VAAVSWHAALDPSVRAPIEEGDRLGEARLVADGAVVSRAVLRADTAVAEVGSPEPAGRVGAAVGDALRAFSRLATVDRPA
jgi:hypothetical protein